MEKKDLLVSTKTPTEPPGSRTTAGGKPIPIFIEDVGNWHGVTVNGNVTAIDLGTNGLSGMIQQDISSLQHLELLDLSDNNIGGAIPGSFYYLTNLEYLNLAYNNIGGPIPPQIGNMSSLEKL